LFLGEDLLPDQDFADRRTHGCPSLPYFYLISIDNYCQQLSLFAKDASRPRFSLAPPVSDEDFSFIRLPLSSGSSRGQSPTGGISRVIFPPPASPLKANCQNLS
jgi:hypothetical protein